MLRQSLHHQDCQSSRRAGSLVTAQVEGPGSRACEAWGRRCPCADPTVIRAVGVSDVAPGIGGQPEPGLKQVFGPTSAHRGQLKFKVTRRERPARRARFARR
jgi:hypothetical protein